MLLKTQFTIRKWDVNIKELIHWKPKDDPEHIKGCESSLLETQILKIKNKFFCAKFIMWILYMQIWLICANLYVCIIHPNIMLVQFI